MSRPSRAAALLVALLPALAGIVWLGTPVAADAAVAYAAPVLQEEVWVPPKPPASYDPPTGVKFNYPLGTLDAQRVIRRHINRTIDSTPAGARIEILSWNIRDDVFVDKLIAAHKRMVTVRVLIARGNWSADNPNLMMDRLKRALLADDKPWSNELRPLAERSRARACDSSCRGTSGIAHAKYYLFSHVGPKVTKPIATDIVMHGSANATIVATNRQWNDLHTLKNRANVYRYFSDRFKESEKDTPVVPPYSRADFSGFTIEFLPWGARPGDPTLQQLNAIRCVGATDGTGVNGKTHVRIGQTAFLDDRGLAIAERLKTMWDRGCNVRIVYALMGNKVLAAVRDPSGRGPIPIQQITQDWNNDGVYDRYLHTKVMAISGVYAGDTSAEVAINGSTNWTAKALRSDETLGTVFSARLRSRYADWVDRLFTNPPPGAAPQGRIAVTPEDVDIPGPDRYHGIEP